jgi:uncharacterized membrane protein YidH (DUF202 family)
VSAVFGSALPTSALLRTRMSWIRTSLAIIVTGFLLVRGGFTGAEPVLLAVLAAFFSMLVIATSLNRFRNLGKARPTLLTGSVPPVITGGIVALAVIACVRLILAL